MPSATSLFREIAEGLHDPIGIYRRIGLAFREQLEVALTQVVKRESHARALGVHASVLDAHQHRRRACDGNDRTLDRRASAKRQCRHKWNDPDDAQKPHALMQHDVSAYGQKGEHTRERKRADEKRELGNDSPRWSHHVAYAHERNRKQDPDDHVIRIGEAKRHRRACDKQDDFVEVFFHAAIIPARKVGTNIFAGKRHLTGHFPHR